MGIQTIKVLRTISKIILLIIVLGLLGWGGYYVYRSIAFKPQNIVVTNITDSSATITWTTSSQMNGVVYYRKDKSVLPGPLGIIGSHIGYDDRDVSDAQTACVNEFNKNASETKDENFSVSGENFDCEDARVTGMGKYYTHSVTIKDLDPESTYYFSMGDGIWSFKSDVSSVKTFALLEEVKEPMPIFGRVIGDDGGYSRDGLVYITFSDGSEGKESILYSSTTNDSGGWYLDASGVRYEDGEVLPLELTNDSFDMYGVYSNYGKSDVITYILGYFNGAYPDIVVEKKINVSFGIFDRLIMGVYADCTDIPSGANCPVTNCSYCPSYITNAQYQAIVNGTDTSGETAKLIGYGNAAKIVANNNGGQFTTSDLPKIGLSTDIGNMNALVSTGVQTFRDTDEESEITINYDGGHVASTSYCKGNQYCTSSGCKLVDKKCGYTATDDVYTGEPCTPKSCEERDKGGISQKRVCSTNGNSWTSWYSGSCDGDTTVAANLGYLCVPNSCEEKTSSNVKQKRSCSSDGKSWATWITGSCDNEIVDDEQVVLDMTKCDIVPTYTGSYIADIGQNAGREYQTLGDCTACGVSISTYKCTKKYGVPNIKYVDTDNGNYTLNISELNKVKLLDVQEDNGVSILENNPNMKEAIISELNEIYTSGERTASVAGDATVIGIGMGYQKKVRVYCEALGLELVNASGGGKMCNLSEKEEDSLDFRSIVGKAYASDSANYAFYLPEAGIYSFELGDYTVSESVSNGNNDLYLFYIETNGVEGFQMPDDLDNPTTEEDIVLSSSAYEITYTQESTAQQYEIEEGINIISFDFVPVSTDSGAYTAEDLITQASTNGVDVQYISAFEGGRWYSGYSCSSDTCTGTNFTIVPGRGYVVYATNDGTITIPGYNLTSSVPVAFSSGWNLVGIHGYTTAYTARTLIDSINTVEGLTANNVSWWPTSKGKYEGLQVENGTEYGLDFAISPTNGYFVRISEYAPSDTTCKSILWNEGGTLNGTCGNTK